MKKIILVMAMSIAVCANAQTMHVSVIEDINGVETNLFCADTLVIHADPTCLGAEWQRPDGSEMIGGHELIVTQYEHQGDWIYYDSNENGIWFTVYLSSPTSNAFNPFDGPFIWKRQGETITLGNPELTYVDFLWSTGETSTTIDVTEPGTYSVEVNDPCGPKTYSVEVRDNVELYRATCDLRTNLNQVTWQTTPEQAEYVSAVNVYRNTYQLVATVPYLDGSFTDNIGSEATQWQYHLVAVGNDGDECPLPSYWKRTIHLDHVQGTGGGEILQWTPYEEESPAKNTVIYYSIYDVVDGEPNHVMDVGNFTNVYAYDPNDFEGYGTVAAVFAAKGERDLEDMAFSNMTADILDVGESMQEAFKVYPNPANGTFTVAGASALTVFNTLGQAVATSHSANGTHTFTLRPGIYFLKSEEGTVQKVVVE